MERKNKNFVKVIALCLPLLLGACGTKKVVEWFDFYFPVPECKFQSRTPE